MLKILRAQVRDTNKCSIFFSAVRQVRIQEPTKKKLEYEWGEPEFKIYPSGIDFGMCPLAYLESRTKWDGINNLKGIYRVKRGKALHWEMQEDFKDSERIYPKPCTDNMTERIKEKLESEWPEVPFHDTEENAFIKDEEGNLIVTGLSGSMDAVIDWKGPTPVEIKSTSIPIEKWKAHVQDNLPDVKHICQVATYMVMANALNYYPQKVEKGILAYCNLLFAPEDQDCEAEFVIYLDKPHPKLVEKGFEGTVRELTEELLFKGLAPTRKNFIENYLQEEKKEVLCTYSKCSKHNGLHRTKVRKSTRSS